MSHHLKSERKAEMAKKMSVKHSPETIHFSKTKKRGKVAMHPYKSAFGAY